MIVLHHVPQSRSVRVLWLLHELGVPFRLVEHAFDKSLRAPEYLTLSPAGRVPALEIEGERMFESLAVMQYLCERFPEAGLGRAPEDMDRMAYLVWLQFAETVSVHAATLTQQHIILREDWMRSPILMQLEAKRLAKCFEAIEARLSTPVENRDYLLTSGFSACDIAVGQAVDLGRRFVRLEPYPELSAWVERITERDGWQKSLPAEGTQGLYEKDFYPPWEGTAHG